MTDIPVLTKSKSWAIYNPHTKKWSRGGCGPKWGKNPKAWGLGPLKNHLYMFVNVRYDKKSAVVIDNPYKDCLLVNLDTNQEEQTFTIQEILDKKAKFEAMYFNRNLEIIHK